MKSVIKITKKKTLSKLKEKILFKVKKKTKNN